LSRKKVVININIQYVYNIFYFLHKAMDIIKKKIVAVVANDRLGRGVLRERGIFAGRPQWSRYDVGQCGIRKSAPAAAQLLGLSAHIDGADIIVIPMSVGTCNQVRFYFVALQDFSEWIYIDHFLSINSH
jgi:hypothetical protein